MTGACCILKFLLHSVDGKHLTRFQCETYDFCVVYARPKFVKLFTLSSKVLNFMCCESVAEEDKMEVDRDQHQEKEKVPDEEPMETEDTAIEEQQQKEQSSNAVNNFIKP